LLLLWYVFTADQKFIKKMSEQPLQDSNHSDVLNSEII
jgi:hypothetical protein